MRNKRSHWSPCAESQECPSILTLQTPDLEEIARAIWARQHYALSEKAIAHNVQWRDPSLPLRYWNEFMLDASAVLSLLHRRHTKYQNRYRFVQTPAEPGAFNPNSDTATAKQIPAATA
jgi:hypothetical protein